MFARARRGCQGVPGGKVQTLVVMTVVVMVRMVGILGVAKEWVDVIDPQLAWLGFEFGEDEKRWTIDPRHRHFILEGSSKVHYILFIRVPIMYYMALLSLLSWLQAKKFHLDALVLCLSEPPSSGSKAARHSYYETNIINFTHIRRFVALL
ncbi:hypothetical protein OG21DRAFT_381016 [Imleria badia]|nr:hypothetical protein OG21DRAFT_381016 [Imleria badia]